MRSENIGFNRQEAKCIAYRLVMMSYNCCYTCDISHLRAKNLFVHYIFMHRCIYATPAMLSPSINEILMSNFPSALQCIINWKIKIVSMILDS